jgi:hypothetical protein
MIASSRQSHPTASERVFGSEPTPETPIFGRAERFCAGDGKRTQLIASQNISIEQVKFEAEINHPDECPH